MAVELIMIQLGIFYLIPVLALSIISVIAYTWTSKSGEPNHLAVYGTVFFLSALLFIVGLMLGAFIVKKDLT
jgi:hypothetical protein